VKAKATLEREEVIEHGPIVGLGRDAQGPALAVADVSAGGVLELGDERGVTLGRRQVQLQELLLAPAHLGDGGEHACRAPGGAHGRRRVEDRHRHARSRQLPGDGQADDAGADDNDVGALRGLRHHTRPPRAIRLGLSWLGPSWLGLSWLRLSVRAMLPGMLRSGCPARRTALTLLVRRSTTGE